MSEIDSESRSRLVDEPIKGGGWIIARLPSDVETRDMAFALPDDVQKRTKHSRVH